MKKLVTLLGALTIGVGASASVIACNPNTNADLGSENLPDTNFTLEKTTIDIDTINPGLIKITNYDVLNTNSMPVEFEISQPEIVQVTVSKIDKALIVAPLSGTPAQGITITAKSKVFETKFSVNVIESEIETQMKLEKTNVQMNTSTEERIKVTNFDYLDQSAMPNTFEFSESGFATAEFDSSNHEIVIYSSTNAKADLSLIIKAKNGTQAVVSIKIIEEAIDLDKEDYITNVMAGNMNEYGIIDPSIAIGDKGFTISKNSVLTSFNVMNGVNILESDVEITAVDAGSNGIGALYSIAAKTNSQNVKGEVLLTLNQGIDPNEYFRNKNLGQIRLFEGALNKLNDVLNSKDEISLGAVVFEIVGDRNKQLEYAKANFTKNLGAAGQAIMKNAVTTATTFQITNMPDLDGIFIKDQNIEFTFRFTKEDRITFYEGLPENKMVNIEKSLEQDRSAAGQLALLTKVYEQLNTEFKAKISLEHFLQFSKVIYDSKKSKQDSTKVTKIDILPGSPLLYAHDGAAFIGYINNPGGLAGASGGGNLEKYEDSKTFETKYTTGMGWFEMVAAMSGNFYQGHVVLNVVDDSVA